MGLKSKLFFTWVAVELALLPIAIPATAQIVDRIVLAFPPRVAAVEIGAEAGVTRYIVSSNSPFAIKSTDFVGEMDIEIFVSGHLNNHSFGTKAQSPGPLTSCASVVGAAPRIVYTGERKTAAERGQILEQSILVEVRYSPVSKPTLSFEAFQKNDKITGPHAQSCKQKLS